MQKDAMRLQRPPQIQSKGSEVSAGKMDLNSELLKLKVVITDLRTQLDAANYRAAELAGKLKMQEVQRMLASTDANAMEARLKELGEPFMNWRHQAVIEPDGRVLFQANKVPIKCVSPNPPTAAAEPTAPTAE